MTEKEYIERLKKLNIMIDERIKNIKIYVDGKSAEIQKVLFALGAKWCDGEQTPYAMDKPFLYVDENGIIEHCDSMEFFSNYENKEVSASEVLSWKPKKPKPVLKPYAPVLVRDVEGTKWNLSFYGYEGNNGGFHVCNGSHWCQCILYEGNEHLLGTTDSPEE